jgi:hypothetical protein
MRVRRTRGKRAVRKAVAHRRSAANRAGLLAAALLFGTAALRAQQPAGPPAQPVATAPLSAAARAPFDLSGYWVSLITRNWRHRMLVPARGDYIDIPINLKSKQFADAWNPRADEAAGRQCEAYGAGIIMFLPERLHIYWQGPNVLRVDTDAGMQTRLLRFAPLPARGRPLAGAPSAPGSWQGQSAAQWILPARGPGNPGAPRYGSIEVVTDDMLPGLLRKNGVPYGAGAKLTEYWELRRDDTSEQWITISSKLQDPEYLLQPYVYDSVFQKEVDGSKWDPSPCSLTS